MSEPSWLLEMAEPSQPSAAGDEPDWLKDMAEPVSAEPAEFAEPQGERPGFLAQTANQLLSGDATEMATGYATTINELRNYDALPWYKRAKYPSDPAEREAKVAELLPELQRWTQNVAQYESERPAPTAGQRAISEAPTLGAAFKAAAANPGDALGLVGPSAAASLVDLPQTVAAGLTMGPKGAATAAGISGFGQDYKASVLDGLRSMGVDPSSAPMLMEAMQKADALMASQEAAKKRAMVVGGASALGTAVGGQMLAPFMKAGVGRELTNVGLQIPTQAVIEGGGEALAQQASGEGYKPGEVAAEMLGGGITAPVDVAQAAAAGFKQQGPDTQGLAAAAQARAAYEATFTETDDGQGGTTFVDGAGNPVGDTLDEARATAARLTPEEVAGRMAKTPSAPAAAPETPAAQAQLEPAPSPMQRGKPRIEPTLEPPATTEETSNEAGVQQPAPDMAAVRPGDAVSVSGSGETDGNPPAVGSGPDMGRVPGVQDEPGGTVGNTEGRGTTPSVMAPRSEPDAALTEAPVAEPVVATEKTADSEWQAFTPDTGTLGIPRAEMPQVKAEHRGALVGYLKGQGVTHETTEVDASTLKPTQAEFSTKKVEQAKAYEGGDRSIIVSSDGHVVDGHHQWLAKRESGEPIKVIRLDKPIAEVLPLVKAFPSAEQAHAAKPASPMLGKSQQANTPSIDSAARASIPLAEQAKEDAPLKFPEMTRPLNRVKVKRPAIEAGTGRRISVTQNADEAVKDVEEQMQSVRDFIKCLRT